MSAGSDDTVAQHTTTRQRWAVLAIAATMTGVFFVNLCDLVFACGCASLWQGGAASCNIHHATGPHCPWCGNPFTAGATAFLGVVATQVWVALGPLAMNLGVRLTVAVLAFPLVGGLLGWLQGTWYGYWG